MLLSSICRPPAHERAPLQRLDRTRTPRCIVLLSREGSQDPRERENTSHIKRIGGLKIFHLKTAFTFRSGIFKGKKCFLHLAVVLNQSYPERHRANTTTYIIYTYLSNAYLMFLRSTELLFTQKNKSGYTFIYTVVFTWCSNVV